MRGALQSNQMILFRFRTDYEVPKSKASDLALIRALNANVANLALPNTTSNLTRPTSQYFPNLALN
jgi:hypothetical protein